MKLCDLLNEKTIIPELRSTDKTDLINELIDLFKNDPRVNDLPKVRQRVLEREKIMSTGVGKSFAVPHGKTDGVNELICAFGKSSHPIEFDSLDQQPVHLVFLLVNHDSSVSMHIKLLSRISRLMTKDEFREKLIEAKTAEEIQQAFAIEEKDYLDL